MLHMIDARVVAIAPHQVADVALAPLVEELAVAEARLVLLPLVERLVHDDEAHPIGQIEQRRRRRVVARANRVDAHRLHDLELPLDAAIERRGAERTQVVVQADA